jgi:hypothetical protein
MPAYLIWRMNLTYRYDNRREGIVGRNPALAGRASLAARWVEVMEALTKRLSAVRKAI